jgi:hypothetical protein
MIPAQWMDGDSSSSSSRKSAGFSDICEAHNPPKKHTAAANMQGNGSNCTHLSVRGRCQTSC